MKAAGPSVAHWRVKNLVDIEPQVRVAHSWAASASSTERVSRSFFY